MIDGEVKKPKVRTPDKLVYSRKSRWSKNRLLGRPNKRQVSGTVDTAFRGRRKAKRVRLRGLQRDARRAQR